MIIYFVSVTGVVIVTTVTMGTCNRYPIKWKRTESAKYDTGNEGNPPLPLQALINPWQIPTAVPCGGELLW